VFLHGIKGVKKARMSKSQMTETFIISFGMKSTVHLEFIPQGQTVNQAYYVETLKRLHEAVHRKRPELCPSDGILHHDSGSDHTALSDKQFPAQKVDY
jgi:hypothetical protein